MVKMLVRDRESIKNLYRGVATEATGEPVEWIAFDPETLRATVQGLPGPEDISLPVDVNIVIEFMSR